MNVLFHSTGWTQGKWVIVGMCITDVHFYAGWISSTHPPMYLLLSESVMSHFKKAQVLQYHTNKCEVDWGVRDFEAIVNQIMACCLAVFSKRWQNNEIKNLFVPVSFWRSFTTWVWRRKEGALLPTFTLRRWRRWSALCSQKTSVTTRTPATHRWARPHTLPPLPLVWWSIGG